MARPEIIAALHAAWYDYRTAEKAEKAAARERYETLLKQAAQQFSCQPRFLQDALHEDFRAWYKQERLPKPPPPSDSAT
jgi:hypothetical protein